MKYLSSFTLLTFVAVALGYGLTSATGCQEAILAALVGGGRPNPVEGGRPNPILAALVEGGRGSLGGVGVEVEAPVVGAGDEGLAHTAAPMVGAGDEDFWHTAPVGRMDVEDGADLDDWKDALAEALDSIPFSMGGT